MKLSDFGLSSLNHYSEGDDVFPCTRGDFAYQAPEAESLRESSADSIMVHSNFDIWPLACIALQFLTWYFDGQNSSCPSALRQLDEKRETEDSEIPSENSTKKWTTVQFYKTHNANRVLKSCIQKKIASLRHQYPDDLPSRLYLHKVLDIIQAMFEIDPSARPNSQTVSQALDEAGKVYRGARRRPNDRLYQSICAGLSREDLARRPL